MTLLCALCEGAQVTLKHPNDNIFGYLGFAVVVAMLLWESARKKKASK